MPNYYHVLGVTKSSSIDDIRLGFRKKALKWHPERNKDNVDVAPQKFAEITKSYEILSDAQLRAIYDQFGQDGLDNGIPSASKPFRYQPSDPKDIFYNFFGTHNPYECFFGDNKDDARGEKEESEDFFASTYGPRVQGKRQPKQIIQTVGVSLEEFYLGSQRRVQMLVRRQDPDTGAIEAQPKNFVFTVKPGMKPGATVRFEKAHHEGPGIIPADVVIQLVEESSRGFTRRDPSGYDLCYRASIPLSTALCGGHAEVQTLDGRTLNIPVNKVVDQHSVELIKGEGLPSTNSCEDGAPRGDLYLSYSIVFPSKISPEDKNSLAEVLENYEEEA